MVELSVCILILSFYFDEILILDIEKILEKDYNKTLIFILNILLIVLTVLLIFLLIFSISSAYLRKKRLLVYVLLTDTNYIKKTLKICH